MAAGAEYLTRIDWSHCHASKQTLGFFEQNLVMEYARGGGRDKVTSVSMLSIRTEITRGAQRSRLARSLVGKRDRRTRASGGAADEDIEYEAKTSTAPSVAEDQIRLIAGHSRTALHRDIPPQPSSQTLIFAKETAS